MDQALNSQKTPHTSPLRASYGMSFVSILMKNDRVIKGFYWNQQHVLIIHEDEFQLPSPYPYGEMTENVNTKPCVPTYIQHGKVNSVRPNDDKWRLRSESALSQETAWRHKISTWTSDDLSAKVFP